MLPLGFFEPRTHASDGRWPLSEALIILQSVVQQEQQHRDLETEGSEACIALRSFGLIGMFAAEDVVPGYQHGMRISKYEFEQLLVEPQTLGAISRELPRKLYTQNYIVRRTKKIAQVVDAVGVDVVILCDMLEIIYEDAQRKGQMGMQFEEMVELVLSMRGSNPATVKDVKEVVRINKILLYDLERKLT
ncbi:mtcA2, partial [Symbiodinium necroappetens]